MAETFIWTAQDELERLLVTQELLNTGRQRQLARTAILSTLREFPNRTRWTWYDRRYTLRTVASQTGTLTYDHTGGSSERLVTLVTATLPTDGTGTYYRIIIGDTHYNIERVLTSSTCMLAADNNPGADVAAGTACTVYRSYYALPQNFRKLAHVYDVSDEREMVAMPLDEWHAQAIGVFDTPGTPEFVTISAGGEALGRLMLVFSPPPEDARTYDILYEAGPQQITTWKYNTGTVATAGTTAVTGTSTVWTAAMVGAVIRFTASTTVLPTPQVGDMDNVDNPYLYQRTIVAQSSATAIVVDATVATLSGVKYTISDPLDIEPGSMLSAFQRCCDAEYASLLRLEDWQVRLAVAQNATRLAIENDQRMTYAKGAVPRLYDKFRRVTVTTDSG